MKNHPLAAGSGLGAFVLCAFLFAGCRTAAPGTFAARQGDEIIVAGQRFHTGTRIITWMDPEGYDAHRIDPLAETGPRWTEEAIREPGFPSRFGPRQASLKLGESEHGEDLAALQRVVDQFVVHYDGCGLSKICFDVLRDRRGLSVHFMLDIDGTIYQLLDLKERAVHATTSNDRAIGIEIANLGAAPPAEKKERDEWYQHDAKGQTYIKIPTRIGDPKIHRKGFTGRPARRALVHGRVQGLELDQYDFTPEQYAALIRLTAVLCAVFPRITCDYPRDASGQLVRQKLTDEELAKYQGILGHFHIQTNKTDPGPAFQWDKLINETQKLMK